MTAPDRPDLSPGGTPAEGVGPQVSHDAPIVRAARAGDVAALLEMFAELAEYEDLTHELRATEKQLSVALFGPEPVAKALIAERSRETRTFGAGRFGDASGASDPPTGPHFDQSRETLANPRFGQSAAGSVIGYALYFPTFSSFLASRGVWLEDLFVRPAHRRTGVGRALLAAVAADLREVGGERLEWAALDWNEPALRFYKALGARTMGEWVTHRLVDEDLDRLADEHRGRLPGEPPPR